MKEIKIFVCCHKQFKVEKMNFLVPIHVGAQISTPLKYELADNVGEHISHLNKSYCELTALYWAWKNCELDYYGLFHYRRYLILSKGMMNDYRISKCKTPYKIYKEPNIETLTRINDNHEEIQKLIEQYDIIMPISEDMHTSVYEHYTYAPNHRKQDIDIIVRIIKEEFPEYIEAMEKYLNGNEHYFGNIFICKKEILDNYCNWLFTILAKYDTQKNTKGYNEQELRVNGYLAERLLGIYYTWLKETNPQLRWAEVPRAHFEQLGNSRMTYYKKRLINVFLPPSSKIRMKVKKIKSKLK